MLSNRKKKKKAYSSQAKLCRINHILAHKQVLIKKIKIILSPSTTTQNSKSIGNSLAVQWLGLRTLSTEGLGSIAGLGNKILQVVQCGQKRKVEIN